MNIVKRALISLRYRINRWLDGPDQMERLKLNGLRYGKNFHLYDSVAVGNPARVIGKKSEHIAKNRAFLNVKPTFHTYFPQKTLEEKAKMIKELRNSDGFDP